MKRPTPYSCNWKTDYGAGTPSVTRGESTKPSLVPPFLTLTYGRERLPPFSTTYASFGQVKRGTIFPYHRDAIFLPLVL
jgi:hypothetical protein